MRQSLEGERTTKRKRATLSWPKGDARGWRREDVAINRVKGTSLGGVNGLGPSGDGRVEHLEKRNANVW